MIKNLSDILIEASYACTQTFQDYTKDLRAFAAQSEKAAQELDIQTAYELGQLDNRDRLQRDTLALCNYLDIILMISDNIKNDVYRLKTAQQEYEKRKALARAAAIDKVIKKKYNDNIKATKEPDK